jgi:hypothetical protein
MTSPPPTKEPITYHRFWPGFYNQHAPHASDRTDFTTFFSELLAPITAQTPEEATPDRPAQWRIISVFQGHEPSRDVAPGENPYAVAHVSYSGEGHHNEPLTNYDVNLIMRETNSAPAVRTVALPLFAIASHVHDFWPRYRTPRTLPPATTPRFFCAFVVSNGGASVRNRFAQMLNAYKTINSCGAALNNCGFTAPREFSQYLQFLSQFRFMICMENRAIPEYLTEKLHNAWLGNTIPIYWGASRAQTWLNPRAFLQLPDEPTDDDMRALVARVAELDNDPAAYAAMFREPLILPDAELPREFRLDAMREDIVETLRRARTPPAPPEPTAP